MAKDVTVGAYETHMRAVMEAFVDGGQPLALERAAWARLVKATIDERDAGYALAAHDPQGPDDGCGEWSTASAAEMEAAKQALRDLGVDVDALLEDR